ncbi:MAG TPA: hypothetical protein IAC82_10765 [Candidatus Merdivicinus intestinigallinarum]|nr:hypothetical protein [Candidatus Merdivicinus intestinigallinarum]
MAKKKKKDAYIDPQQRELRELIELKKMQQAAAEHPEEVQAEFEKEEPIVPKTFKEKWKNYWYHYKGATWGGLAAVVLVVWLIKDIFFGPEYDLTITTATNYMFSALNDSLASDLASYAEDYNGDGKTDVTYDEIAITLDSDAENVDMQVNAINIQKLMAVFASGEDLVFILEQEVYDYVCGEDEGIFVDLSALYPDIDIIEGDKLILNDTALGKKMYLNGLEEDVFLCVRDMGGTVKENEKSMSTLERSLDFVENILREEYPDKFPADEAPADTDSAEAE